MLGMYHNRKITECNMQEQSGMISMLAIFLSTTHSRSLCTEHTW